MKTKIIKDRYCSHPRTISNDVKALNPLETKMIEAGELTCYGRCPYCKNYMNPDRWYLYDNGYECKQCGHKTYMLHEKPFDPCDCKNCKKNKVKKTRKTRKKSKKSS